VICSGRALAKSKAAEVRMLLDCLETWRVGVWRCVVLCCGVERQKRSFEEGVLGLIGADDLCQG
jgi:hypothetical protein